MSQPLIELENVFFSFGSVSVLSDVQLTVQPGEFASIVGPNGGGKTTLVRIILGLLQPQSGSVKLFGENPLKTRLRVGYTPQYASVDLQFPMTVEEIVLTGRLGVSHRERKRRSLFTRFLSGMQFDADDRRKARLALDRMQIGPLAHTPFADLSGGQKQRVFIARALVGDPELLILDEPTNNIDPSSMENFYELLAELNSSITIVVVTHDLGVVSRYVRSVICVNRQVVVHPTSALNGTTIRNLYGTDVRLIRHDHRCSEQGHENCHILNKTDSSDF